MKRTSNTAPYRILVSIGNDDTSDPAIVEAIQMAHRNVPSELHCVHVLEQSEAATSGRAIEKLDARLQAAPQTLQSRLTHAARAFDYRERVIGHLGLGTPSEAILQVATDIEADLIVLGTHHRRGLERIVLGSVAEEVMRDATCAVMIVTAKNYAGRLRSARPDPACAACLKVRAKSTGAAYWCDVHARPHIETHVFEPTDKSITAEPTGVRIV